MKVVLFCGGLGTRLRDHSGTVPKPMVNVGYRPIIWHLMRYYAHYGHNEFILCLGYKGDYIKNYFLHYDECVSNDFVMQGGGKQIELLNSDIDDWRISFIDTGQNSNLGERLMAVRPFVEGEEMFLANYTDALSDLDLHAYVDWFRSSSDVAGFVAVQPSHSFHVVEMDGAGKLASIRDVDESGLLINGGFFAFRPEIFQYMRPGEELVDEPFRRLMERKKLAAYRHEGFWACMDTYKDKARFDAMNASGDRPWEVWNGDGS